jgi:Cu-Zn family superoxide dismutase
MVDVSHGMDSDSILNRHVGDLGNIEVDADGGCDLNILDWVVTLGSNKTTNVIGLPLMIHNLTDDGGHTGRGESNTTG